MTAANRRQRTVAQTMRPDEAMLEGGRGLEDEARRAIPLCCDREMTLIRSGKRAGLRDLALALPNLRTVHELKPALRRTELLGRRDGRGGESEGRRAHCRRLRWRAAAELTVTCVAQVTADWNHESRITIRVRRRRWQTNHSHSPTSDREATTGLPSAFQSPRWAACAPEGGNRRTREGCANGIRRVACAEELKHGGRSLLTVVFPPIPAALRRFTGTHLRSGHRVVVKRTSDVLPVAGRVASVRVTSLRRGWHLRFFAPESRVFILDEMLSGHYVDELQRLSPALVERAADGWLNIVDAGANVGLVPLFLEKTLRPRFRLRCVGFEPLPDNRALCERNWQRRNDFVVRDEALSDTDSDSVTLFVPSSTAATIVQQTDTAGRQVKARTTRLDRIWPELGLPRLDIVKLDIEGAEEVALTGAKEVLVHQHPFVLCSYEHGTNDRERIVEILLSTGHYVVRDRPEWQMLSFQPVTAPVPR